MSEEDSFVKGMKGTLGVIAVVFIIFVIAPCTVCGGMAMLGKSMEDVEQSSLDLKEGDMRDEEVRAEEEGV